MGGGGLDAWEVGRVVRSGSDLEFFLEKKKTVASLIVIVYHIQKKNLSEKFLFILISLKRESVSPLWLGYDLRHYVFKKTNRLA